MFWLELVEKEASQINPGGCQFINISRRKQFKMPFSERGGSGVCVLLIPQPPPS